MRNLPRKLRAATRIGTRSQACAALGSLTGKAIDNQDTLDFSVLQRCTAMIETFPFEQAADGYNRMMQSKARFRIVLVMGK